ncbi:MAG: hypothetical protein GKC04_02155 [Methanomicrobiales archaeon]|nr:hypothetical protein [Methanomicrobiales archaeon]
MIDHTGSFVSVKRILVPPMLVDLIQNTLASIDGAAFTYLTACPDCGGAVRGYDMKKKLFARVIGDSSDHDISVFVKRFRCVRCGRLCYADSPFYPGTRLGAPIVDLCIANAGLHAPYQVARLLGAMRIRIDRGTIRKYLQRTFPDIPVIELYGTRIPVSLLALPGGVISGDQAGTAGRAEAFRSGSLPPAERAALHLLGLFQQRDQGKDQEKKEKGKSRGK